MNKHFGRFCNHLKYSSFIKREPIQARTQTLEKGGVNFTKWGANRVTRKTGKHLMTGKRRKMPENTKIPQKNTSKGSYFMVYNVTLLS